LTDLEQMNTGQQKSQPGLFAWLGWFLLIGFVCRSIWVRRSN
jgi:hypothetical protein